MQPVVHLRVLGSADLGSVSSTEARNVLAHPKRLALLTFLCCKPGFHRRDELFALLWPESDAEHARNSLRQAVHQIRRSLGSDAIVGRGEDEIALGPGAQSDLSGFHERLAARDWSGALGLYGGDLLASFHVGDAPDFESWLETERRHLLRLACGAAWSEVESAEAKGAAGDAARWARWAATHEPLDEVAQQRLIATLDRLGDRAGALQAYEEFSSRLNREFESEPAAETQSLIAGVRLRSMSLAPAARHGQESAPEAPPVAGPRSPRRGLIAWQLYAAGALTVLAVAGAWSRSPSHRPTPDTDLVVVAPFRISGSDTALAFLREGMVDLLAATLASHGGLRTADPRTVVNAWQARATDSTLDIGEREALQAARSIRGGQLLLGSIVGRADRFTLNATLIDTRRGDVTARATVNGPLDSLPEMVDQMAGRLLSESAGEPRRSLAALTSASLPALHAYLNGRRSLRQGRYADATAYFDQALAYDSLFALAAMHLVDALSWNDVGTRLDEAKESAWKLRHRLLPPEQAYLAGHLGPRYPARMTWLEGTRAWQRAVELNPDRPEAWYQLGDYLLHYGLVTREENSWARSREAFANALELDSTNAAALTHLFLIASRDGDTASIGRLADLYLRHDSVGDLTDFIRWARATATRDSAAAAAIEARMAGMPVVAMLRWSVWPTLNARNFRVARRAAAIMTGRSNPQGFPVLCNEGHFAVCHAMFAFMGLPRRDQLDIQALLRIVDAIAWDADPALAGRTADSLAANVTRSSSAALGVHVWRLWTNQAVDSTSGRRARDHWPNRPEITALLWPALDALEAARRHDTSAARLTRLADQAYSDLFNDHAMPHLSQRLIVASYLILGDTAAALQLLRRRVYGPGGTPYLAGSLREQGRLAAAMGETEAARVAYTDYLLLRTDPDPALRPYVDSVRAALALLPEAPRRRS